MNARITSFFFAAGVSIATRPRQWLLGAFLVFLVFTSGVGYPGLKNESRGDKLWFPADTQAQDDLRYVDQYYGAEARFGEVILKPKDGGSALRPAVLASLRSLVDAIEATAVQWDGATLAWDDQCSRSARRAPSRTSRRRSPPPPTTTRRRRSSPS